MVAVALLLARGVLAVTFLVAGLAKLVSGDDPRQTFRDFGAPRAFDPLAPLLPWGELAVAIGCLFAMTAWYAAWAAAALLVIFILGITVNLARGRQPDCNCFGQLRARPISWRTLVRNGVLVALAAWLVASGPPPRSDDAVRLFLALDTHWRRVTLAAVAVFGLLLLFALRQPDDTPAADEEEEREPEPAAAPRRAAPPITREAAAAAPAFVPVPGLSGKGLDIGTPAPSFTLPDLNGEPHGLDARRAAGKPVVVVFSSLHCESCQWLMPRLPGMAAARPDLAVVLVSRGTPEQNRAKLPEPGAVVVLLQKEYEVSESFNCTSTPAAVVVGADGSVASELAIGGLAIQRLIADYARS